MKTKLTLLLCLAFMVISCKTNVPDRDTLTYLMEEEETVFEGMPFTRVNASSYAFNETETGRAVEGATYAFESVQSAFLISDRPITKEFFKKITDKYIGSRAWPKKGLSVEDINQILDKIYLKTKMPFVIPTEAMVEAGIKSGAITVDKRDEIVTSDGWYKAREPKAVEVDWKCPETASTVVLRTLYSRTPLETYRRKTSNRFYLALRLNEPIPEELIRSTSHALGEEPEVSDGTKEVFQVSGAIFTMLPVKGGPQILGTTPEQQQYAESDENPAMNVIIENFKIGETEVTVGQWLAIMDTLPIGNDKNQPNQAVGNVSFFRAQEFIRKLNQQTGRHFRLPTENEWEYAARGGQKSHNYIFAGSNNAKEVAVCSYKDKNKNETIRPQVQNVKSKHPNELGIYDMSGSQWEWVIGTMNEGQSIQRGGSWKSLNTACRVSNRQAMDPRKKKDTFGFRLAL